MIKFTIVLRRHPKMTHQEFVEYHRNHHAPLFCSLPEVRQHVRRYVQCHSTGEAVHGIPDSRIDGTTELWFEDAAGLLAVFTAPRYMELIRPDEEKFLDLRACEFLVGIENPVI
jgi:uncharacterized protein (TIGR02118 family)